MNLLDARVLLLDLQTTGSSLATGNVLELAWCIGQAKFDKPHESHSYLLAQPDAQPIPRRIQSLTGISDSDMASAVDVQSASEMLMTALATTDLPSFVVIHFAQFERPFLQNMLASADQSVEIICTHQIAARLYPNLPSRGIRGLAGYFGLPIGELKRAHGHVNATFDIWRNVCRELKMRGICSFEELQRWLQTCGAGKRTKFEYPMDRIKRLGLPDQPGVYRMLAKNGDVLYVGKATSLRSRVNSYFRGKKNRDTRKLEMLTQAWDLRVTPCRTALEASLLEVDEIKRISPPYNVSLKGGLYPLVFYSRDFQSSSSTHGDDHPLGPFRSVFVMQPLLLLAQSLKNNQFDPRIFFEQRQPELLAAGFEVLLQRQQIRAEDLCRARSLLALGMRFYRQWLRITTSEGSVDECMTESIVGNLEVHGLGSEAAVESRAGDDEGSDLSPDDIADRYERLLMHSARAMLLAGILSRLLNATVQFEENGLHRQAVITNGTIVFSESVNANGLLGELSGQYLVRSHSSSPIYAWTDLGLDIYDRMRVLHTELQRLRSQGADVSIHSHAEQWQAEQWQAEQSQAEQSRAEQSQSEPSHSEQWQTETPLRHSRKDVSAFS